MSKNFSLIRFVVCGCAVALLLSASVAAQTKRSTEQQIRQVVYEFASAQATGDVETVKRLTAKRTLALYRFAFDALLGKAPAPPAEQAGESEVQKARDADAFFALMIRLGASAASQALTQEQIKEMVRAEAERAITFLNPHTAKLTAPGESAFLVVFEDGGWKVDHTESVKEELLNAEGIGFAGPGSFTSEQRERIQKF